MSVVKCEAGHYFDQDKYPQCPHCGVAGAQDEGRTVALGTGIADEQKRRGLAREHLMAYARMNGPAEDRTVSIYTTGGKQNPIVGWLVCIEGLERGQDFRLHAGRNYIGRAPTMDVCLPNDPQVHRENHCSIIYEPNKKQFLLLAGEGALPLYNGDAVGTSQLLAPYDRIGIGSLTFCIVPFCGEAFSW